MDKIIKIFFVNSAGWLVCAIGSVVLYLFIKTKAVPPIISVIIFIAVFIMFVILVKYGRRGARSALFSGNFLTIIPCIWDGVRFTFSGVLFLTSAKIVNYLLEHDAGMLVASFIGFVCYFFVCAGTIIYNHRLVSFGLMGFVAFICIGIFGAPFEGFIVSLMLSVAIVLFFLLFFILRVNIVEYLVEDVIKEAAPSFYYKRSKKQMFFSCGFTTLGAAIAASLFLLV
jgi:preprotein translocase subunit SecG